MRPAAATLKRWGTNVNAFALEELKFQPDRWQEEFFDVLPSQDTDKKRISLQACTGPGKTAVLSVANHWFITTQGHKGAHPRGLCTSITGDNLRANLWPELSVWQQRSEFLKAAFRWTATRYSSVDHPETWFLEARNWPKKADPKQLGRTLSGLHAPYVMVTIDESGDVPVPVLQSAEQILSSQHEWAKILQGGNPTSLEGALYHAAVTARHLWFVIRVTGDPDDAKRSPRINLENARQQIALYGRSDPWIKATILGEFPETSINALLGIDEVQAAMERRLAPDVYNWAQKRLGVDVSRFGDDLTVLFPRQGLRAFMPVAMRHKRGSPVSVNIANRIMMAKKRWKSEVEFLDATGGWAAGARDILVTAGHSPLDIQYAAPALDRRYKNMRAQIWWEGSQWVKAGGWLPNVPELVAELTTPTYTFVGGQMLIEPKDRVKEKIGRSPNYADALYQTFAIPDMPSELVDGLAQKLMGGDRHHARSEWDPHSDESQRSRATTEFDPFGERI
jgi:phage terminase large subunit